jgi:hypothetical protein
VCDGLISAIQKTVVGVLRYRQILDLWNIHLQMMVAFAILRVIRNAYQSEGNLHTGYCIMQLSK